MRRQFQGGRLAPHPGYLQPHPPQVPPPRHTSGAPRGEADGQQPSEAKPRGPSVAARFKAAARVSTLLSTVSKKSGQPPAVHPPWNKARVGPMEAEERGRERLEERREERLGRGESGKRDDFTERGRERGGRGEMETWGSGHRNGIINNGLRNVGGGREGVRPEHRGQLPGLSSFGRSFSVDGGLVFDESFFQTSLEASKPRPVKQKLSEALGLISLARRLQGPARVGGEQWSDGPSWDRGEDDRRRMNGSIGDMSVSASVRERATGEARRRWESGEEYSSSERRRRRGNRFQDSGSETGSGSKESLSESDTSSGASSVTADRTPSDTETEKNESDSGAEREERTADEEDGEMGGSQEEGGRRSESEKESGLENDDEQKKSRRKRSKGGVSKSCARTDGSRSRSAKSNMSRRRERSRDEERGSRYSRSTVSSSRPKTSRRPLSSHETIEEEEESEEDESGEDSRSEKSSSSRRTSSHTQTDIRPGASDDLSPIIEDAEEEEEEEEGSSGHAGEGKQDEAEGCLENESAD